MRPIRFLLDFWWFANRWSPVSAKWRSPGWLWRLARRREAIRSVVRKRMENPRDAR